MDLESLTPGEFVTALEYTYRYAGQVDGRAVLVETLTADLSQGFRGHPHRTGHLTAIATGLEYPATIVHPRHLQKG